MGSYIFLTCGERCPERHIFDTLSTPMPSHHHDHSAPAPHVLIIGGGISGILLAILLERGNYDVTIVERNTDRRPAGGGITLTLNGIHALRSLGLLDDVMLYGNEILTINIADAGGVALSSFDLSSYAATYAPTLTILRTDLHNVLFAHLQRTRLYMGVTYRNIAEHEKGVEVVLTNGHTGVYDLVVGCDGIHSSLRQHLFPGSDTAYAGYSCWRFVVNNAPCVDHTVITEMWGRGKRFGIVPLGNGRVHCFASTNTHAHDAGNKEISLAAFRALFSEFGGAVPDLLCAMNDTTEMWYNDLEDIRLPNWQKGRTVLLGDAAHGMTPNMTQGASMAIEDVITLAAAIQGNSDIGAAPAQYFHARKNRVGAIQRRSWMLGRIGQVENKALCTLRDLCWRCIPDSWIQNDMKELLVKDVQII